MNSYIWQLAAVRFWGPALFCSLPILPSLVLRDSARLRYFTFFYLYVMQGIPGGFSATAICYYLIAQGVSARAIGTFSATVGLPWVVQFSLCW